MIITLYYNTKKRTYIEQLEEYMFYKASVLIG